MTNGGGGGGYEKQKLEWEVIKDFTPAEDPEKLYLVVRVSASKGFRPRYSIQVGRLGKDESGSAGRVFNHLPIFTRGQGRIEIIRVAKALTELIKEAEDFVHNAAQYNEDLAIEARQSKEKRGMAAAAPPKGLKALGKIDAAKRVSPTSGAGCLEASSAVASGETIKEGKPEGL